MVTAGAASALALGTAACMTGTNREFIRRLPDATGMKTEVIIQKSHRYGYDRAVRNCGTRFVEVESREELEDAINDRTVMMLFYNRHDPIGQIKAAYGENDYQAFLQNAGVLTSFRATDDTAEYLSRRMGEQTAPMETYTQDNISQAVTKSKTGGGYPLMHASQFGALKKGEMVVWCGPLHKPFKVYAPGYWEHHGRGLNDNPYFKEEAA